MLSSKDYRALAAIGLEGSVRSMVLDVVLVDQLVHVPSCGYVTGLESTRVPVGELTDRSCTCMFSDKSARGVFEAVRLAKVARSIRPFRVPTSTDQHFKVTDRITELRNELDSLSPLEWVPADEVRARLSTQVEASIEQAEHYLTSDVSKRWSSLWAGTLLARPKLSAHPVAGIGGRRLRRAADHWRDARCSGLDFDVVLDLVGSVLEDAAPAAQLVEHFESRLASEVASQVLFAAAKTSLEMLSEPFVVKRADRVALLVAPAAVFAMIRPDRQLYQAVVLEPDIPAEVLDTAAGLWDPLGSHTTPNDALEAAYRI